MILAIEEVHIIGRHRLEAEFLGELEQNRIHFPLRLHPVVVNLHIGVGRAENFHQLGQCLARLGLIARMQPLVHRTRNAPSEADHPLGKLPQRRAIDPRLAMIKPLEMPLGNQLRQIFPSLVVLRQQCQMRRPLAPHQLLFFLHRKWREINLTPKNRLHPRLLALLVKLHRPKQIPMIGHRHRRHPHRCRTLRQIPHADHSIQQRKLTVDMQVDKRIRHRSPRRYPPPRQAQAAGEGNLKATHFSVKILRSVASFLVLCITHSKSFERTRSIDKEWNQSE